MQRKSLTLKDLERDKKQIEDRMQKIRGQITQLQVQLYRLDGVMGYLQDNIKKMEGKENDR